MSKYAFHRRLARLFRPVASIGIRSRMLISFGVLFALAITAMQGAELYGVPFTGFGGETEQLRADVFAGLNLVADLKKERLLRWLEERRDDATVIAESPAFGSNVSQVLSAVQENVTRGSGGDELWASVRKEQAYRELVSHLNLVQTTYGEYNALEVVDALSGTIIASTEDTDLGRSHSETASLLGTLGSGDSLAIRIVDDPGPGGLDLLVALGVRAYDGPGADENDITAMLVLHVALDDVLGPVLHTGGGLGATGEVVLVNQDVKILTSLAYPLADGSVARPLEYQITARPAVLAARGEEGIIRAKDYRGEPVLAAYRNVPIAPGIGWGMVVKRDEAEIFGPLRQSIAATFYVGFGAIILVLTVAYMIAGAISRPIRRMQVTALQVEGGDYNARVPVTASGELRALARTFNTMIERVQEWNQELEKQVQTRTDELTSLNMELEQRVIVRTADLEFANKELEAFSYSISHDLRAPLRAMDGFSRILMEDYAPQLDEEARRHLQMVRSSAQRMGNLVDDLLSFSRLGRQTLEKRQVAPAGLVQEALKNLRIEMDGRQVDISAHDLPTCHADATLLQQVFSNLLDNALKFTRGRDTAKIEIGSYTGSSRPGEVVYFVKDNGVGFDMQYVDKLFGVFQRLHLQDDFEGTGVGLAIVQRIIHRHGGLVWAEAEVDNGATFYFTLEGGPSNGTNS